MKKYIEFNSLFSFSSIGIWRFCFSDLFVNLGVYSSQKAKYRNFCLFNLFSIFVIISSVIGMLVIKNYNLQISKEIKYVSAKIEEQDNYTKILKAELAIITTPVSLGRLYEAYYDRKLRYRSPKVGQIKNLENMASFYQKRKYSQLTKSAN